MIASSRPHSDSAGPAPAAALRGDLRLTSIAWALIVGGAVLRLVPYLDNRSLWHDEARLALNIADRSYAALFGQLDYNQAAPPGFLVVEKLALQAFGDSEYALRLFPLLCGLIALPLFWAVASRLLAPWGAVGALALFALAEPLLYYASEVKQYGVDVAATLGVLFLATRLRASELDRRHAVAIAALGLLLVLFSHAATIVLSGVAVALAAVSIGGRDWPRLRRVGGVGLTWAISLALYASLAGRTVEGIREGFRRGLPDVFAPLPPQSLADLKWYAASLHGFAQGLGAPRLWALFPVAVGVAGAVSLARRDRESLGLLLAPVAVMLIASGLELYPLQFRFQLFLVPIALLLVGEATSLARRHAGAPAAALLLLGVAAVLATATTETLRDNRREEIRPLVAYLGRHARPGDSLYVYSGAQYAFSYYAACRDCGTRAVASTFPIRREKRPEGQASALVSSPPRFVVGSLRSGGLQAHVEDVDRLAGSPRAWFVFSHYARSDGVDDRAAVVALLDRRGRLLAARETQGAALYLYDLRG